MRFRNRTDAGRQLAERLKPVAIDWVEPLILALPRGGIEVGAEVSRLLNIPLTVFIVRKIGAPGNPEYAIGAVAETGTVVRSPCAGDYGDHLEQAKHLELERIVRYKQLYRDGKALPPLEGRTVILVDDGVATGATLKAALQVFHQPDSPRIAKLVAAIPVAPLETAREVGRLAHEAVFLHTPEVFFAVSQFYDDFRDLPDDKLRELLGLSPESR